MQETRIDPCGSRLIRSFIPWWCAVTIAPVVGAVTVTPMPLQPIRVPALTLGISAVDPMTLIVWGVDPLYASVAPPPPLFVPEPQPAPEKPRTASSTSATIRFTTPVMVAGRADVNVAQGRHRTASTRPMPSHRITPCENGPRSE